MSSDEQLTPLELRLRREADGLLQSFGDLPHPEALVDRHRQRVKRRVRVVRGCAVATVLVIAIVSSRVRPRVPGEVSPRLEGPVLAAGSESEVPLQPVVTPHRETEPVYPAELMNALPIFLVQWDADGQPVVTAGFYVPEPEVRLSLDELTPGERYAVQQVLGPGGPDLSSQTL
jgi:hypothetical protein